MSIYRPNSGRGTARAALATLTLLASVPAGAQNVVVLRALEVGQTQVTRATVAPGGRLTLPVLIDMAAAGGTNLGALATGVSWGSSRLTLDSVRTAGFGTLTSNLTNAPSGSASISTTVAGGTTSTATMANLYFTASATAGGTTVSLSPTSASDNGGANILPLVRVSNIDVCIAPSGVWGDVNVDAAVNVIDAQQVARFSVGLSVLNAAALTSGGDVTADNAVNIIDAQQIARFSVALSAAARVNTALATPPVVGTMGISSVLDATAGGTNPGVSANLSSLTVGRQAQVRATVSDTSNADVTACATISYDSSNPAVASVSPHGLVSALAPGTTVLTITSGTVNATMGLTVMAASSFAVNAWTNAAGGLWRTASNWSLARAPLAGDSVTIALPGTYTVTLDAPGAATYVTVGGGSGTQSLSISSTTLSVSEVLTTAAGSVLRMISDGNCCGATVTAATGVTNNGAIEFANINAGVQTATLAVTAGTLVNAPGGTITSLATGGAAPTLAAPLDNRGTITLHNGLTLARANATHTSSGTIAVNGGDLTLAQSGTNPSFTTTAGAVTIAAGRTMAVSGGALIYNGGAITGAGTLVLNTTTLTLAQTFTNGVASFTPTNATVTGPGTFVNGVGQTLTLRGTTVNTTLDNRGVLLVPAGTSSVVNGILTTAAGSVLRMISDGNCCGASLTVSAGVMNQGAIELTNINSGVQLATLAVTTGTLVNAPGGTITSLATGGGARMLAAQLDNQGTITVQHGLTLARASAAHTNSGTIDVSGGDLTLAQSGTNPSFTTTAGTVTIAAGRTMAVSSGALIYNGGAINGAGTLALNAATLSLAQTFSNGVASFATTNATVTGPGTFVNGAGQTLTLRGTTVNTTLDNQGVLLVPAGAASAVNGILTTAAGSVLRMISDGNCCGASLTVSAGVMNQGAIELTNINSGVQLATLAVTTGTLVNAPGGTITSLATGGGARTLAAQLDNQGTVTLHNGLTLARASAAHTNSGTIDVSGGDLTLAQSGTNPSFTTTAGTVTIAAGRTMAVSSGALIYNGGAINGAGTLALNAATLGLAQTFSNGVASFATTNATVTGPGTFVNGAGQTLTLRGTTVNTTLDNQGVLLVPAGAASAVNGILTTAAGSVLRMISDGNCCGASLTVSAGVMNQGAIELTNINSGVQLATLAVTTGTLVNAPGGTITSLATGGGARTLAAQLDNQGTVTLHNGLTLARASAAHTNSGTIDVSGGDLTLAQSGTNPSFTTTAGTVTIAAGRTMAVSSGALIYNGGAINGAGTLALNAASLSLAQTFSNGVASFATTNATVTGPGTFVNGAGQTLTLRGTTVNTTLDNQGVLLVPAGAASAVNGILTTAAGSMLRIISDGNCCGASLTVSAGVMNQGAIELTNINSGAQLATLAVTTGTLVNAPGGTITSLATGGASRTLAANLDNQGTLSISPGATAPLTISGSLTTSGVINVDVGGPGAFDQLIVNGGSATLGGTLTVTLINGFVPQAGQTFTILTSTAPRTGVFGTLNLPGTMTPQYGTNAVVLVP